MFNGVAAILEIAALGLSRLTCSLIQAIRTVTAQALIPPFRSRGQRQRGHRRRSIAVIAGVRWQAHGCRCRQARRFCFDTIDDIICVGTRESKFSIKLPLADV